MLFREYKEYKLILSYSYCVLNYKRWTQVKIGRGCRNLKYIVKSAELYLVNLIEYMLKMELLFNSKHALNKQYDFIINGGFNERDVKKNRREYRIYP